MKFNCFKHYSESDWISGLPEFLKKFSTYQEYQDYYKNVHSKIKQTKIDKYGDAFISSKVKETNIKRYGVDNPNKSDKIITKRKKTNLEKYGNEFGNVEKRKENYRSKTGYDNPWSNPDVIKAKKRKIL